MTNAQKTPFVRAMGSFAQRKALDEIEKRGSALPGHVVAVSGPIVTVNFDVKGLTLPQIAMPIFGSEYVRLPIQAGDKGAAFPVDFYLGGISGLGGGTADDTLRGNLSALVWFPLGNKNWSAVDANAVTLYGPNGVVTRDTAGHTTSTLTPAGIADSAQHTYQITAGDSITLSAGGHTIVINSSGVTIDGKVFLTHHHSGVQVGGSNTGDVV